MTEGFRVGKQYALNALAALGALTRAEADDRLAIASDVASFVIDGLRTFQAQSDALYENAAETDPDEFRWQCERIDEFAEFGVAIADELLKEPNLLAEAQTVELKELRDDWKGALEGDGWMETEAFQKHLEDGHRAYERGDVEDGGFAV